MDSIVGFIGIGLIGGSLAKALKEYNLTSHIIAYDKNKKALEQGNEEGIIDTITSSINEQFSKCDYIFLCCPVAENIKALETLIPIIKPSCIISDVGSTKSDITSFVTTLKEPLNFIGGHPMTGSEKSGYHASNSHIFENAYYILTPSEYVQEKCVDQLHHLLKTIGAIPIVMKAKDHDFSTAAISHIPHILASSLVNLVKNLDSEEFYMHTLAAGGFKDITRIASSSPLMWQQICLANKENILTILENYQKNITSIQNALKNSDTTFLYNLFETAKDYRDSFDEKALSNIPKAYTLTIDIEDRLGTINEVTSLLSAHTISIKNIAIINNRERDNGVLSIVFYDEESYSKSYQLLSDHNYGVYQ